VLFSPSVLNPLSSQVVAQKSPDGSVNKLYANFHRDLQEAFSGMLFTKEEAFPFSTIRSSDKSLFMQEVIPLLEDSQGLMEDYQAFVTFFALKWPCLAGSAFLKHATLFFVKDREAKLQAPLPDIAVYLMVIALGKHCNIDNPQNGAFEVCRGPNQSSFSVTDVHLSATYQALRLCSFLSSPSLSTIHAQLLIGVYLRNTERSASFWPLLGSIARQAQAIGLHVDPTMHRSHMEDDVQVLRRQLWWAIVQQDAQLSSIFGRPLAISSFSTRISARLSALEGPGSDYHEASCCLAILARRRLERPPEIGHTAQELEQWTDDSLDWYRRLPQKLGLKFTNIDALQGSTFLGSTPQEQEADISLQCAPWGLKATQQACDLATDFFTEMLLAHRPHLSSNKTFTGLSAWLSSSKMVCTVAVRNIRACISVMAEHLGCVRMSVMWRTVYIVFQASVSGYLAIERDAFTDSYPADHGCFHLSRQPI
jgi:hypothetical protein